MLICCGKQNRILGTSHNPDSLEFPWNHDGSSKPIDIAANGLEWEQRDIVEIHWHFVHHMTSLCMHLYVCIAF